ncbi:3-keto-disaccharide hydrolase [Reichenbachiella ulvae]|uniref:DUF1080 domain-containing protein n=1 Tax=Reichenbachiella ulvae TaxID=2980104 RepID=A0ABT3CZY7_9BACT|nr:DUF1080 domain-containing protein [Reichenbachiella ulvae]MCV9389260.1 DUF1080 domain-containing protein [Reichenbachiella ulvae]
MRLILLSILLTISSLCHGQTKDWTPLWNGKNLNGWQSYLDAPDSSTPCSACKKDSEGNYIPFGTGNDPLQVYSVVELDGEKVIRVSGQAFGTLETTKIYGNYHLKLKFKWGEDTHAPRLGKPRDSGLLYHAFGEGGSSNGKWPHSQEMQIQQGDVGDYWSIGRVQIDIPGYKNEQVGYHYFEQGSPLQTITHTDKPYHTWRCIKAFDNENKHGEWNEIELLCLEDQSIYVVNGRVVMRLFNSKMIDEEGNLLPLEKGKIILQSEGAEIFYKDIEIKSIENWPSAYK